jgi:pyrroloquinoline quinone (PQQ) biosynthesis protein C
MMSNTALERIQNEIEPLRQEIINHKVYSVINDLEDLRIFMQYHVYAVWDFMSLLKSLQINLTCTTIPWFPVGSANNRYLINEIVAGEESDIDSKGERKSHFEMYLEAMNQCDANTAQIDQFVNALKATGDLNKAYELSETPAEAKSFVDFTFKIINSNQPHLQASTFTFGREDLIPNMFLTIVNDLNKKFPDQISLFKYYLDRHIEVDGDHHSHLALEMTSDLCGTSEEHWKTAEQATIESLKKRIELWDGAYNKIMLLHQVEELL